MLKMALFSDIHGNLRALEKILKFLEENEISKIYHLGDSIAIGPKNKEVLDLMRKKRVNMIRGNHEDYYIYNMNSDTDYIFKGEADHQRWVHEDLGEEYKSYLSKFKYEYEINYGKFKIKLLHYPFKNLESKNVFYPIDECINSYSFDKIVDSNDYYYFFGHDHRYSVHTSKATNNTYVTLGSSGVSKNGKTSFFILNVDKELSIDRIELDYDYEEHFLDMDRVKMVERDFIKENFFDRI
jgi:predicted phosphodiesterase